MYYKQVHVVLVFVNGALIPMCDHAKVQLGLCIFVFKHSIALFLFLFYTQHILLHKHASTSLQQLCIYTNPEFVLYFSKIIHL